MLAKDKMKTMLKGMSPDLMDNVILLCGGSIYDCYRMLRDDAGIVKKRMQSEDMLSLLNINNGEDDPLDFRTERKKITINNNWMLQKLSTI